MTTFFGTLSRAIAAIALVSSLGACALSPGMTFDAKHRVDPLDPNSVAEIREITPSLVPVSYTHLTLPTNREV